MDQKLDELRYIRTNFERTADLCYQLWPYHAQSPTKISNIPSILRFATVRNIPRSSFQPSKNFAVLLAKQRAYVVSCIVRRNGRSNTLIERIADSFSLSRVSLRNFATRSSRPREQACGLRINVFSCCNFGLQIISIHKRAAWLQNSTRVHVSSKSPKLSQTGNESSWNTRMLRALTQTDVCYLKIFLTCEGSSEDYCQDLENKSDGSFTWDVFRTLGSRFQDPADTPRTRYIT